MRWPCLSVTALVVLRRDADAQEGAAPPSDAGHPGVRHAEGGFSPALGVLGRRGLADPARARGLARRARRDSLTEHLEYRPHKADVAGGALRAFEVARPVAARLGMLLVPGVEITRPVPGVKSEWPVGSAHFNVLFPTDVDALDTPDLAEALSRAKAQGAFVFWNHPGFMDKPAMWFPHVGALFEAGLFSGIEVVNGDRFYPEALRWAAQRRLTPLACSDAHLPMPAHLKSADRPITLVFARTKDLEGLKEALVGAADAGVARQSGVGRCGTSDRAVGCIGHR